MDVFAAIADPTRSTILERLITNGNMAASEIYKEFTSSPPAISQHLKALRLAKLVRVEKRAQQRIYFVNHETMKELGRWVRQFTTVKERGVHQTNGSDDHLANENIDEPMLPFE
ncbi:MAG TPA: metalloregulator ArsR/SmtB family transcription factor [Pyrinomonadaceae bacterium]|nr:helix-turn-helix transcriptional regulator [Chloracidobacterium sp.]MBP9936609.1 helix-turn-helix transcriptional regulator [Pyrinomonadaceae bacterium]MBK7802683.1 helix-turn-helix transcriptional regulator [Chloracidobacterium sp.]MBK9437538.1 helix-turn-helix transcriptional regulator [Chloracidobacterium sp.]MBK9767111.1 helix-turn-helix transcriptional regulator [Chloracidobacterium sp.]